MALVVYLDHCNCCNFGPFTCEEICDTLPTSISVTVSGLQSDYAWCGVVNDSGDCSTDFAACIAAATSCGEECDCAAARDTCLCDRVQTLSTDKCVENCPCASANGEWVMEPVVGVPCSYIAEFSFCEPDYSNITTYPAECPLTNCSTLSYGATLTPLGSGFASIDVGVPWTHATVSYWTSGPVLTSTLCAGGSITLNPTPSGTVYADEVNMGCGCGTNHSFRCGDIAWVCSQDPFTTCDDTSQAVTCSYASHSTVSVSGATVVI